MGSTRTAYVSIAQESSDQQLVDDGDRCGVGTIGVYERASSRQGEMFAELTNA